MVRLLKLGIYDPAYLGAFYRSRPDLAGADFAVQHEALIRDRVASSDFWTRALGRIGYETADIMANAEQLQRRWAWENGFGPAGRADPFDIAREQVRRFAPDVVLVADYSTFSPGFLRRLREENPSIRRIVGWCGAPYRDLAVMREWDVALSCVPELVAALRAGGIAAHHVNHGFEPAVLDQLAPARGSVAFSFLGSVVKRPGFHEQRERLLVDLLRTTPLEIWSNVPAGSHTRGTGVRLRDFARRMLKGQSHVLDPIIARKARPALFGLAMFQQLRDSAVTLNTHIDVSTNSASNMRLFEATGVGACLLTDQKDNLREMFEPDSEVVTYSSSAEAAEKFRYLADHPAERAAIAAAGQRRALKDHNFDLRAARIDEILRNSLKAG